jgi:TraY domain
MTMTNKPRKRAPGGGRKPKGPISGNAGWLQARITEDLRARLEHAATSNGRSLSQEAQTRLQESFDLPSKMREAWGPAEVRALAQLVSRVVRSVQVSVGANPFAEAGDLAWHRNAFTHAAVHAAISILLANYKPTGAVETPPEVKKRAGWVPPDQAEAVTSPESVGRSCALGVLSQYDVHREAPKKFSAGAHYGESHYVFPQIRKDLGDSNDE